MKKCCRCKKEKEENCFGHLKYTEDRLRKDCKDCRKNYAELNKNKIKLYKDRYYQLNKKELLTEQKEYYIRVKEKHKERNKRYYENNKEKITKNNKKYYQEHKEQINAYKNNWDSLKKKIDPSYKLATLLRSRLNSALKTNLKIGSFVTDLGCSIKELKIYLEDKFQSGMTWNNHGDWHLDHIKPLSSFDLTDRSQFLQACHYTNLQPLWARDNLIKGAK